MSASDGKVHFSLVVLCYRSEEGVIPLVEKLHRMLGYYKFPYELILVGNYFEGSDDRTPEVVKKLEKTHPRTRAVVLPKQGMMGWDMRTGLDAAAGDIVGVIDGDGQFPLESVISCLIKLESEGLDLVKTYRVRRDDGVYRRFVSFVYNRIFGLLFGTRYFDINSKPKIIRQSKYRQMGLRTDDWFTDAEITIRARELDLKVAELPIHFYTLDGRKSFVRPRAIIEFLKNLWRFRDRRSRPRRLSHANV